jgi:uncharacterized membrane protein
MRIHSWRVLSTVAASALLLVGTKIAAFGQQTLLSSENVDIENVAPGNVEAETLLTEDIHGALPADDEYWLGVQCADVSDELRDELKLDKVEGVVVMDVVAGSPAAKAALQKNDVLLAAGDEVLGNPRDLVKAVRKVKDKELKLKLIRGGERKEITVKPEKRREVESGQQLWRDPNGERFNLRIFRPGHVLPARMAVQLKRHELPDDMTVTISKHGKDPAKIKVQQAETTWETTDENLDNLPEEIRPHVEPMLGRLTMPLPPGLGDVMMYVPNAEKLTGHVYAARSAAKKAAVDAESAARATGRDVDEAGRQAIHEAEQQAREIVHQAREKVREAHRAAEKAVLEQADVAIDKADSAVHRGRARLDKHYEEKLDEVDRRLEELRGIVKSLRESRQ